MGNILKTLDLTSMDALMIPVWGVCFVVLWRLLATKVFNRFLLVVEARDAATSGAHEEAQHQREQANKLKIQIEDRLAEVRGAAVKEKLAVLSSARADAQQIIEKAETQAEHLSKQSREALGQRLVVLRQELEKDCDEMARAIVAKLKAPVELSVH